MMEVCKLLEVVSASHDDVLDAVNDESFKDFEDALQEKCAETAMADFIITGNLRDFQYSDILAVDPDSFLQLSVS